MKNKLITIIIVICLIFAMTSLTGCRQSERVSYNISKEADNFNVIRRFVVINAITDKPMFELVGAFSFEVDSSGRRIIITVEVGDGIYKKHSVGLPEVALWNVEDISGAEVSKYRYEVNYSPEMILPIEVTAND